MNSTEARTETGEIRDQGASPSVDPSIAPEPNPPTDAPDIPEKYEFTAPEGKSIDPKLLEEITPIFKELKLDQAGAQKLVDIYNKSTGDISTELAKTVEKTRTEWRDAVAKDPVVGTRIREAQVEIGRAKDHLPADVREAFNAAMDFTGAGDHPAVFRAMYELAKLVNEGTHVSGGSPSIHGQNPGGKATPPSAAAALYPNLVHQ